MYSRLATVFRQTRLHEPPEKAPSGVVKSFNDLSKESGWGGPLTDLEETLRGEYDDRAHAEFLRCRTAIGPPTERRSQDEPVPVSITVSDQREKIMPPLKERPKERRKVSFGGAGQSLGGGGDMRHRPERPTRVQIKGSRTRGWGLIKSI
jgi:hypothetical protein